jgi:hypothetical protein
MPLDFKPLPIAGEGDGAVADFVPEEHVGGGLAV